MAFNKPTKPIKGSFDQDVVILAGNWAVGATGAVGAKVGANGLTLTRTGVGTYSLQLYGNAGAAASVPAILAAFVGVEEADADPTDDTDGYFARVLSRSASTGGITFQTHDEAGVARDPASGAYIMVAVYVRDSTITS